MKKACMMAMNAARRRYSDDLTECPLLETPDPFTFHDENRECVCLRGFRELYESKQLFDITLSVDGQDFECHKSLLASSSDYFRAMFTADLAERNQPSITINGVDAKSMELVIHYLYTSEACLTTDTVQNLLSAANLFQLKDLKSGCARFMSKKLDIDNCIGIHFFAQAHECEQLEFDAWDVIAENFESVCQSHEFLELTVDNLVEIIKFDDLQVTEEEVFEACVRWLEHSLEDRREHVYELFSEVRFALIDEYYFYDKIRNHPVLQLDMRMQLMFDDLIKYKLLRSRWMDLDLRLEPRYASDFCRVIVYSSYMDDEKKQVLQLYGQRSDEVTEQNGNVLVHLPHDIQNPALLVTGDNDLYIAGGDGCGNTLYKWCSDDNDFEELASMMEPRKQFCLVQVDKAIYAVGGCNHEGNLSKVSKYSEVDDEWEAVAPMPKALRNFCAVPYKGKLYVFGGESEKSKKKLHGRMELNKQALCYDPRENKWTVLSDMMNPRALAGCTVFRNKIYVIGGFSSITDSWVKEKSPQGCLTSVEIYDPENNTWDTGPDLPLALCAMGVVKYYGTIYVLAGEGDEEVSSNVYLLNSEGTQWEFKDEMVTGVTEMTIHSSYATVNVDLNTHTD